MIIDSHVRYAKNCHKKPFRYVTRNENGDALSGGDLPQLMQEAEEVNIRYFIEPGVNQ